MKIVQGETRIVLLVGGLAIKVPNFLKGYRQFLYGLVSNHQEVLYSKTNKYLLPVKFSTPGSCLVVFPRCVMAKKNLTLKQYNLVNLAIGGYPRVDHKAESFGYYKGDLYVIDYGTTI